VKVKKQKLASAKKLPTVKPMKTTAKKLPMAKKYGSTNTPFKAKRIKVMKPKPKPINASYELDEMAWFMKAKAKIDQMTHPRAYDKMIKDYVNRLKSSSMDSPGHIAGKVAREYGVPARNFQQYVNKLVSTGVLPSDLKAQYQDESFSFKDFVNQIQEVEQVDERIVWKKPHHKSEHDEVHTQAGTEAGTFPDHVHKFLNHLKKPDNYHAAMKGGTTSRLSPRAAGKMGNTDANNPKGTKGLEGAKVKRVSKSGPQTMPIALKDTHTGHTHLLAGNTRTTAAADKGNMTHVHTLHYDSSKNHDDPK
jgi:hypothetical protein